MKHGTESHVCLTVYVYMPVEYHQCCLKIPLFCPFLDFLKTFSLIVLPSPPLSNSSAQALCLSDEPRAVKEYRYPEKLPGELYDADTQCKWQFGEKAKLCTLDFKKVKVIMPSHAIWKGVENPMPCYDSLKGFPQHTHWNLSALKKNLVAIVS